MTNWILMICLAIGVWGFSDTLDRDNGAAKLWFIVILVTCVLMLVAYADESMLLQWP